LDKSPVFLFLLFLFFPTQSDVDGNIMKN
jgi:hypothetical protein